MELAYRWNDGAAPSCQVVGVPAQLWPRGEVADFIPWLVDHLDALGRCLGMRRLEYVGRELRIGEQGRDIDSLGRERWVGGYRLDIAAHDDRGRSVVIEAQLGDSDSKHLGQLMTYGRETDADVLVWVIAPRGFDHPFSREHLTALAELNEHGRRQFCAVEVSLESEPRPAFTLEDPLVPHLRMIDLAEGPQGFGFAGPGVPVQRTPRR